jgi:hypothetical protein
MKDRDNIKQGISEYAGPRKEFFILLLSNKEFFKKK